MAKHAKKLTDAQYETLQQLKRDLSDILTPFETDPVLLKWLRARNFNLRKTATLFREVYNCKKVLGYDTVVETYKKPEVLEKHEFITFLGYAKDGTPIQYIASGKADFFGFLMSMCGYDIYKSCTYVIEKDIQTLKEMKIRTGLEINEITYIMDLESFSIPDNLYKSNIETALDLVKIAQDFYPEIWANIFCINAPLYFDKFYKIFKPLFRFTLLEKIHVIPKDATAKVLRKYIDEDVLPVFLGGRRVDSNGDPMCSEFVKFGGKIPEKYYFRNHTLPLSTDDLGVMSVWVPARGVFNHSVVVHKPDSKISIEYRTEGGSIYVGFLFRELGTDYKFPDLPAFDEDLNAGDGENSRVSALGPGAKVQCHLATATTIINAPIPGIYICKFDNNGSWLTSRRLIYRIHLAEK